MGDRANFGFTEGNGTPTLFLYAHDGGHEMLSHLAHALDAARSRWDDPAYATRIAISQLIGKGWDSEYGYGLSIGYLCDNNHSIPIVDWSKQTVSLYADIDSLTSKFTMSLDAFVKKFAKTPAYA
jgi:hypothetical protein